MESILDIAKRSFTTLWTYKYLWFFGFFVAAAGGGGGGGNRKGGGASMSLHSLPAWFWPVMAAAVVLGLVFFILSILSEAALIEGVADGQKGERLGIRRGLRHGRRHFWRLIALKLLVGLAGLVVVAAVAVPVLLGHLHVVPLWAAITLTVLLALVALPALLTVYFVYEYALRFVVLEDRGAVDALRYARRFLHGRIGLSIKLVLLAVVGNMGGWMVIMVAMVPAAALAGVGYLVQGVETAIALGSVVAGPLMILGMGAMGTFRSSVWTLGFMDEHYGSTPGAPAVPTAMTPAVVG